MARRLPISLGLLVLAALSLPLLAWRQNWLLERSNDPSRRDFSQASVGGMVFDADGPVANAIVRFKGSTLATHSDSQGRFVLAGAPKSPARITAWKEGYLIGGGQSSGPDVLVQLTRLPAHDNPAYAWVDPTPDSQAEHNCGNCHAEIHRQWSQGAHANSARNRRLLDLYEGVDVHGRPDRGWNLLKDTPNGAAVCGSCHAPAMDFADPASDDMRRTAGVAAHGVHCDYCHKVRDVSLAAVGLAHGRFGMQTLRPTTGQLFFGPLDDVDRGEDAYSAVQRQSSYCAACHEGILFGVHVYSTYSEWLASPAREQGKQCQSCHMRPDRKMTNIAPAAGGIERDPGSLASHDLLPGGQAAMLRRCLDVDVVVKREDEAVSCRVQVLAHDVGHRVPTGFIDRHLILVVQAFDNSDNSVTAASGPTLPPVAGDNLADQPGRLFARLLTDEQGQSPIPFWRAVNPPVDTRLLPNQPTSTQFRFPATATNLRVRLLYRRFWQAVATEKSWPLDEIAVFDQLLTVPSK